MENGAFLFGHVDAIDFSVGFYVEGEWTFKSAYCYTRIEYQTLTPTMMVCWLSTWVCFLCHNTY